MKMSKTILLLFSFFVCPVALAAENVVSEIWNCKLKEGASIDAVQAANSEWVKFVNGKFDSDPVKSVVLSAIVGDYTGFLIVDTYTSLTMWNETKKVLETEEADTVNEMLDEVLSCSDNTLYNGAPS